MEVIGKKEVLEKLSRAVKRHPTQRAAAKAMGVSAAQLCNALNDSCPLPPNLLKELGISRETVYLATKRLPMKYRDGATKDL